MRLWLGYYEDDDDAAEPTGKHGTSHRRRGCWRCRILLAVFAAISLGLLALLAVVATVGVVWN